MSFTLDFRKKYGYALTHDDVNSIPDDELNTTDYTHLKMYESIMWKTYQDAENKMNSDGANIIRLDIDAGTELGASHQLTRIRNASAAYLKESGMKEEDLLETERVARCSTGTDILENDLKVSDFEPGSPYRSLFGELRHLYETAARDILTVLAPWEHASGDEGKSYNYWKNLPTWIKNVWVGKYPDKK